MSDKKCEQSVKDNCDQIITRLDGMNKDEMAGVLKVLQQYLFESLHWPLN